MEIKKTRKADIEQQRTTGFLLGLILVLAVLFVALEWTDGEADDDFHPLDLSEMLRESDMVPMSNVERLIQLEEQPQPAKTEKLRVIADNVELAKPEEVEDDGLEEVADSGDGQLATPLADDGKTEALAPMGVDMDDNPLSFRVVEDLPQFPGGAVELMKWLTRNLQYPPGARQRRIQGKVVAQFYVEEDGSITGIALTRKLHPELDNEALRVLGEMPKWKAGVQNGQPCRTKICVPIVFKL